MTLSTGADVHGANTRRIVKAAVVHEDAEVRFRAG
jgi:hypothetical protein